jgi:hypothetical protein
MDEYQRRKSCAVLLACMKSKFKPIDIRIRYISLAIVVMGMNGLLRCCFCYSITRKWSLYCFTPPTHTKRMLTANIVCSYFAQRRLSNTRNPELLDYIPGETPSFLCCSLFHSSIRYSGNAKFINPIYCCEA